MGVAEKITTLPGGAELAGILQNLSGSPDTIRGIAKRWRSAASKTGDHAGRIKTAVTDVDEAWQGASADAFVTYMAGYRKAGHDLHDALNSSANALDTAATTLETARAKVGTICGNLLDDVDAYTRAHPDADDDAYTKAVSPLVSAATSDARPHAGDASAAVTEAMKNINHHLGERDATFAAIKSPGDQTFVPGPGHTVRWEPTPDIQQTSFQSGDGKQGGSVTPGTSAGHQGGSAGAGPGGPAPQPLPFSPGTATGARIVEAARLHLGKPYVWGADGPSAFDCSGLVFYTLNQAGIKIGDTTAAGYQASGQPVSTPQPGDIVFFGQPAGHVGVYIGDGKMIHAPHPGAQVTVGVVANDGRAVSYRRFT
ncbi:bifunctional WXG100 family type VII secretion target/C40 family peptidase [Nonomuraea sp. NPDC002799]